jgi:hypothetical protein
MFVQWCVKGISGNGNNGIDEQQAAAIVDDGIGMLCRWWQQAERKRIALTPAESRREIRKRLTLDKLERHLHDYQNAGDQSAFLSLSAGCVEREAFLATNLAYPARVTALEFATHSAWTTGYLYICWVMVAMNPAAEVEGLAEEVRELSTYRRYSPFHAEGEVMAKLCVPSNQIMYWERWGPYPYDPADLPDPDALPYYEGYSDWVKAYGPTGRWDSVDPSAIPIRIILEQAGAVVDRGAPKKVLKRERVELNQRDFTDPIKILNIREMIDDERPYP